MTPQNHKCSVAGCLQGHEYGKHVANEYQPRTKTVTYELRGFPLFIVGSVIATIVSVAVCFLGMAVLIGVPVFFALWGAVALIDATIRKVRSYRRAKAPTWRERRASDKFIRR